MIATRRSVLFASGGLALALVAFLLFPSPIDAVAHHPAAPLPFEGGWAINEHLTRATLVEVGHGLGPESLAVADDGTVFTGTDSGDIVRIARDGTQRVLANTGGRPFGMELVGERLFVADAGAGLLSVTLDGEVTVLTNEAEGVPFVFTDDLAVASDGRVYFSDASDTWGPHEFIHDLIEMRPHGRLLRYDPTTKKTEVLARDLYFANGVALATDESFLVLTETWRNRVLRYHLTGDKAGRLEPLLERVPGFPDNVTRSPRGTFWVAMHSPRKALLDETLHPRPWLKEQLMKLPAALRPKAERHGLVFEIDGDGRVLRSLHDPGGEHLWTTSSAREVAGRLWIGTQAGPALAWLPLDER
jgi:sugar lactone lactonase YvrE